ncbi:hypothetical protein [Zavarzinia compransoris]|uniref:DUF445 domain-containing protein n=1 Tax=Zavarzinia compransoris TaxID=1264899 RepID=A0A317EFN1_9PROT|nr:hypothetical protein [Zavarzinia compransoris]PWR23995.1 hypothetical protein DKG75_05490 [Zavarzinia compransoris]TDP48255.1 hypothetical protein DES42_102558 [Zavarzinia compransoris]
MGFGEFWAELSSRPDFWGFVTIPITAAVVTWVHVWMAMQMVFYPVHFVGLVEPFLGWQGVVPRKARKMSNILVEKTLSKIGTLSDFMRKMEPERISEHVAKAVSARIEDYVDDLMSGQSPVLWANLPRVVRNRVYNHARGQLSKVMGRMMDDIIDHAEDLVDVREMIGNQVEADRSLVVRMFMEVGNKELSFVIRASFWIGLAFGLLQMVLFYFIPAHWMLPAYAAILGFLTNWIALSMVFRPLKPIKFLGFRFQGVFLQRQAEIADKFAELAASEMLTIGRITREILVGRQSSKTRLIIKKHLSPMLESPVIRTTLQLAMGPDGYAGLKSSIAEKSTTMALDPLEEEAFNKDRAKFLSRFLAERTRALTPEEFQDLLRPAFQEDEWIFFVLGAVTGFLAGSIQLALGFQ